jgi:hypothetical protein
MSGQRSCFCRSRLRVADAVARVDVGTSRGLPRRSAAATVHRMVLEPAGVTRDYARIAPPDQGCRT